MANPQDDISMQIQVNPVTALMTDTPATNTGRRIDKTAQSASESDLSKSNRLLTFLSAPGNSHPMAESERDAQVIQPAPYTQAYA